MGGDLVLVALSSTPRREALFTCEAMPPAEAGAGNSSGGSTPRRGASLAFRDVRCAIMPRRVRGATPVERVLLDGVSGFVPAGDMYALMGGSGAGKTTLLDMAAQRKSDGRMSGGVLLDGRLPSRAELKRDTAYIQQDDALLGWVTVAETLAFTAEMKLPASMPKTQKAARCEEVLDQMGLQLCRNTFVGSRLVRGVSGGERKRTSVACGLLGNPRWCVAHMRARSCRHDAHRLCHASTPYVSLGCGLLVVSQPLPP